MNAARESYVHCVEYVVVNEVTSSNRPLYSAHCLFRLSVVYRDMNSLIDMLYYISIFITSYRILRVSVVRTLVDLYQDHRCDSRRKSEACTNIENASRKSRWP